MSSLVVLIMASIIGVAKADSHCLHSALQDYPCDTTTCQGYLAYKPSHCSASSKCPAVVVIQDWNGMNDYEKERAGMLADMGYVGFAADIYGIDTPSENMQHWIAASSMHRANASLYTSKIQAALTKVKSYDFIDTTKIAVIGYCFGGTGSVNMAILGTDILGVVGYHSGIVNTSRVQVSETEPVKITAKVLLHSGAVDDEATDIAQLEEELERGKATFEIVRYGNAVGHSFTEWSTPVSTGSPNGYNARADYRSWESTKLFLVELFSGMPAPATDTSNQSVTKMLENYTCSDTTCEGYLAYNSATCTTANKCPAVVVIQDWNGMNDYEKMRSNMVAGMDYVGFAADIYGYGTPAEDMNDWIAESSKHRGDPALYMAKITAAIDKVKSYPYVDTAKIAVIGYCFGGTGIVNMAIMGSDVLGVVGYHSGLSGRVMRNKTNPVAINTKILMHSGVFDDAATDIAALEQDFEDASATYEIARYGNKVDHGFTVSGGNAYNARADYRSWESTKLFLHELFMGMPQPTKSHSASSCTTMTTTAPAMTTAAQTTMGDGATTSDTSRAAMSIGIMFGVLVMLSAK